jgi:hypothetical protein
MSSAHSLIPSAHNWVACFYGGFRVLQRVMSKILLEMFRYSLEE